MMFLQTFEDALDELGALLVMLFKDFVSLCTLVVLSKNGGCLLPMGKLGSRARIDREKI